MCCQTYRKPQQQVLQWRLPNNTSGALRRYETTANVLAYTIYCLCTHPEAQRRAVAEVDAFGRDRMPEYKDLVQVRKYTKSAEPACKPPQGSFAQVRSGGCK